jgi:hypothetical protein
MASKDVWRPEPEIVENYRDFEPPRRFRRLIADLLDAVPSNYLIGLKTIVLTNRAALTRDQLRQKIWQQNRKHKFSEALGAYYAAERGRSASVWLLVDNILQSDLPWIGRMPIVRDAATAKTLYHEIGHHIHKARRPVYEGKENVAEDWSKRLSRRFFRKRYRYLIPLIYPLGILVRLIDRRRESAGSTAKSLTSGKRGELH